MIKYYRVAQDLGGNVLPGATVQIKNFLTGVNAPIYQDDGVTPKANPVTCDSSGIASFHDRRKALMTGHAHAG